jgi:hypothetical protein
MISAERHPSGSATEIAAPDAEGPLSGQERLEDITIGYRPDQRDAVARQARRILQWS